MPLWPAFPDTVDALRILKRHYKLVILSNVHRDGFAASNRKLGVDFDAIYTAEDVGSYKPSNANFEYLFAHLESDLGMNRADVLHTAQSLHHDHTPAKRFGLANAWIDRQRLSEGGSWGGDGKSENRAGNRLQVLLDGGDGQSRAGRGGVTRLPSGRLDHGACRHTRPTVKIGSSPLTQSYPRHPSSDGRATDS